MMEPGPNVTVGGVSYPTVMDGNVQRFVADPLLDACFRNGSLCLNKLATSYQLGESGLTQRQYAEIHMKLGYSIGHFYEIHDFSGMEIVNPLWPVPSATEPSEVEDE